MTIDYISWDIRSVYHLLRQLSFFSSCKEYVYNCTDVSVNFVLL